MIFWMSITAIGSTPAKAVEQDEARARGQRAGDLDAPPLAAGERDRHGFRGCG